MAVQGEVKIVVSRDTVKASTAGGATAKGVVDMDQLRLATIKVFEGLLLDDTIRNRRFMEVLGQHLYAGILSGAVDKLLTDELRNVKKDRLRLLLQFESDADPALVSLPWEFLYSPARQDFLATDVNLVLSRFLELGFNREQFIAVARPLRVLVAISRPADEGTVLAKEVVDAIRNLNKEQEVLVELATVDPPTLDNIEAALKQHQPHIFHFIGHGRYDPVQRTGSLLLVNPSQNNNAEACDDSTLIDCFKRAQCFPRLVFLHMCEGGISERDATALQAFSGFGPKLIHANIPSVVAMQYPIKNPDAREFSKAFYATLAEGGSVDEAVQEGRSRLDLYRKSRVFGTPVLYMHSAGGLVVQKPPAEGTKPSAAAETSGASQAPHAGEAAAPAQPAGAPPAASAPAPLAKPVLDLVFDAGITAAQSLADSNAKIAMTQRLAKLKKDLAHKGRTEIFNALYQKWASENDSTFKDVLLAVMEAVPAAG
jgi:hypothetical protein